MRSIYSINENWVFLKDSSKAPDVFCEEGEKINLPHTWNAKDGQDGGNNYFRGKCRYLRLLLKSELPQAEEYYLEINGANSSAEVYINGERICAHDGGYSAFRANITAFLREENCLAVIVDNSPNERVYPQTADFTFYGGLYRDVNVIAVPKTHFALEPLATCGIRVRSEIFGDDAEICVSVKTEEPLSDDRIRYSVYGANGEAVCEYVSDINEINECKMKIKGVRLWQGVEDPYLYTVKAAVIRGEEIVDEVSVRHGVRSFKIDPQNGFILNGKEYPLRGVSRHQDRKDIGNALLKEHHREDMELIREVGANTIRLAHYQHDQYFYDLCDEYGMVVWAEIPYISRHLPSANENCLNQMKELIEQCYNHSSIVVWGLSNEITMDGAKDKDLIEQHKKLNGLVHTEDPTRLTVIACLSTCGIDEEYVHIPDVVSYNHYFGWYGGSLQDYAPWFDKFHEKYPNTPIGCSEYGCEALNWHNSAPQNGDYSEEYQAKYHESLIRQLFPRKYIWATHVWNMFDFGADARAEGGENGQNHKGLITIDRKYKKDAFYAYKAWLSKEPFVHICSKRYVDRAEDVTKVTVYSNNEEVELFANGVSVGKKRAEDHFFYFEVPLEGTLKLLAEANGCKDECEIRRVEKFNPDYILREQGAVLNWFDITEVEGKFSLNDRLGDIIKTFRGKLWFAGLFIELAKKQSGPKTKRKKGEKKKKNKANMDGGVMNMISSFTVLRFTGMLGMRNINFTKEELLKMNKKLNRISKPKSKK